MADSNQGPAFAALAAAQKLKHEEAAAAMKKNAEQHDGGKKVEGERTFYSRISGSTYIFANGKVARFPNGEYVTNKAAEIEELEKLCDHQGNHTICSDPVPVQNINDAIFARDVSSGGQHAGTVRGLTTSLNAM